MKYLLFWLLLCSALLGGQQRIVALSPAIDEILFALGKGSEIVGNTTYATYPEAAKKIFKVGGYFSVSLEKIVSLSPTLVLMQKNNLSLKPKLEKLGIKTEVVRITSMHDIEAGIVKIGALTQTQERAKALVAEIEKSLRTLKGILHDKKILIVFGVSFDLRREIYVSGNNLYFADIIKASGNKNAYEESTGKQPTVSQEGIIAMNPDIVYILAHRVQDHEKDELITPWLKLPITAAKAKTVYVSTHKYAGMPSQRVVLFINDFKKVLEDAQRKLARLHD